MSPGKDPSKKLEPTEQEKGTDRLVYEYKTKNQWLEYAANVRFTHDEKTGEKLFHPKVDSLSSETLQKYGYHVRNRRRDVPVHEDMINKGEAWKNRRRIAEAAAVTELRQEIQANQVPTVIPRPS
jgi:hypothetical protein